MRFRLLLAAGILALTIPLDAQHKPIGLGDSLPDPGQDGACLTTLSGKWVRGACSGTGGTAFDALTTATNTSATMTVGAGATLTFASTGIVNASQIAGNKISAASSSGQIPIYDQPSNTYVPGDPLVQGTQADASVTKPNPVLGAIWDGTNLRSLAGDSSGRQTVNVNGTVPVSGTFWQATQPVSGTFWQATQPVSGTVTVSGQINCNASATISTSSAGDIQLVALSSGQTIYVCGFNVMAGGTTNVQLEYGTGSACGTGKTALTGAYPLIAQTGVSYGSGAGAVTKTAASNALCVNNSAAVAIAGIVTYTQF